MKVRLLTESDARDCVQLDLDAVSAVAFGFAKLAEGAATVPSVLTLPIAENNGGMDVKAAYIHGESSFAVKLAAGFYDNAKLGLPTGSGMMIVLNAKTGFPEAVILDNGYLTSVRTGAAGALAAKYLARKKISTAGVIGSGSQARYQIRALRLVRNFEKLMVYGVIPQEVEKYAAEIESILKMEVCVAPNVQTVVEASDVVVTTTPSCEPYLRADWLHPGLHITCMGADRDYKQELFPQVLGQMDVLACDLRSQCFRFGELHHGVEQGIISESDPIRELGEIISGRKVGRESDDQITLCDLTGVGVQDTAIALLAYRRACELGIGQQLNV